MLRIRLHVHATDLKKSLILNLLVPCDLLEHQFDTDKLHGLADIDHETERVMCNLPKENH